jgi:hypothetical protein
MPQPRCAVLAGIAGLGLLAASPRVEAKDEIWRQDSAGAFGRGKAEGVVVAGSGAVRLSRALSRVGTLDVARVWKLARSPDGALWAATGDAGQVFRRDGDGPWQSVFDSDDTQVFAVAVGPGGRVVVGTGPSGQIVELGRDGTKRVAQRLHDDVKYVWDLAFAPDGTLYAATGPTGQLWKRPPGDGASWELAFDSPQPHLLSLAVAPDGAVYAGSDGAGLIYRVSPDGRVSVVLDAPQDEIHVLSFGPDGAIYAGTAVGGGGPGAPGQGGGPGRTGAIPQILAPDDPGARPPRSTILRVARRQESEGGTARLRGGPPGENIVYRVEPGGAAREIFRARVLVYALAWQGDRLLIGTGPEGRLFEVRDLGREVTPLARLDHGQVLALLSMPDGVVWIGAGDAGAVLKLEPGYATSGTLTSDVLDARLPSRFGALTRTGAQPPKTRLALAVRTGNVAEPDATWSDWVGEGTSSAVPNGRFAQYRATLETSDPGVSPELKSVSLAYRTLNLPPEIASITVPDIAAGDGTVRRSRLDIKWEAGDPNDDELIYTLSIQKDGWPDWLPLGGPAPLTEKTFAWDTTTVPAGVYRLRVSASDRPSNRRGEALERSRTSEPFVVDHLPPTVAIEADAAKGTAAVRLEDGLTRLVRAEYSLDGGPWSAVFPDDGLFDATRERITLTLPELKPGTHVVVVRATDAAGNIGAADVVFRVP